MTNYSWLQMIRVLAGKERGDPYYPGGMPPVTDDAFLPYAIRKILQNGSAEVIGTSIVNNIAEPIPALKWKTITIQFSMKDYVDQKKWISTVALESGAIGWYDLEISHAELVKLKNAYMQADRDRTIEIIERSMAISNNLINAIGENVDLTIWRTRIPMGSRPPWTQFTLARGMVTKVSGYDADAAAAWLMAQIMSVAPKGCAPEVRTRFKPGALAELEEQSVREHFREIFPALTADYTSIDGGDIEFRPGCCAWYVPRSTFEASVGDVPALTLEQVEWHGEELRSALDREFIQRHEASLITNKSSDVMTVESDLAESRSDLNDSCLPVKLTARAEAICTSWLIKLMSSYRDAPIPKDVVHPEARGRFPGLSDRAFARAWIAAARSANAESWLKPGQRPTRLRSDHDTILSQS